jgi:hypothetical protein
MQKYFFWTFIWILSDGKLNMLILSTLLFYAPSAASWRVLMLSLVDKYALIRGRRRLFCSKRVLSACWEIGQDTWTHRDLAQQPNRVMRTDIGTRDRYKICEKIWFDFQ